MLPQGIRLFSWVDVEDVLLHVRKNREWPEWLKSAQAYWDGLTLRVVPGKRSEAIQWLADVFAPRFYEPFSDTKEMYIILEALKNFPRQLNIILLETEDTFSAPRFLPMLGRPEILTPAPPMAEPENFPKDFPPLIAVHSFKGGVGRTMTALATAKAFTVEKANRVLLIDADLEAPGITWMLRQRLPSPAISFADVITLLHGASDSADDIKKALELICDRIQMSSLGNICLLPAFRSDTQFTSVQIRPEHLIRYADNPYIITHALSQLGKMLGATAVVADLRAGLSELSAGFLLDPRVRRIFVTTLSPQSVRGTEYVLRLIRESVSSGSHHPLPKIIFSQIPASYADRKELTKSEIIKIKEAGFPLKREEMLFTIHEQNLMVPKPSWDGMMKLLDRSLFFSDVKEWMEAFWLSQESPPVKPADLQKLRKELEQETTSFPDVESGEIADFFQTTPIRNLANDFRRKLPIAVIEGAEGSGKSFACLQIIRRQEWKNFTSDMGIQESVQANAGCYPAFYSKPPDDAMASIISSIEKNIRQDMGLSDALTYEAFIYEVSENIRRKNLNESQWRNRWLNLIAWRMGFGLREKDAGERFPGYLRERKKNVIAVIDGLEDILHDIFMTSGLMPVHVVTDEDGEEEQGRKKILQSFYVSLRSLLRDVPLWLEQQPGRPMGILIFIRSHIVRDAFFQDGEQFADRYMPYALNWHLKDALQLCLWIFRKISSPQNFSSYDLSELSENRLRLELKPLWGRSFMPEDVSDFSESVIAGDMIRFLHVAAKASVRDSGWKDSLLTPDATSKSANAYFMELTQKQQTNFRLIRDNQLRDKARTFVDKNGVITNIQMARLENIANTAVSFSDIEDFVKHQADEDHKEFSGFYKQLSTELDNIRKDVKKNRDFIPHSRKEVAGYHAFFSLLFVREFIRQLSTEHRHRSGGE